MGEMVRIRCEHCDVSEDAVIGVGRMGRGEALVSCTRCRTFRRVPLEGFTHRHASRTCPECGGRAHSVESAGRAAPCPRCGQDLHVELTGLWD